MVLFLDLEESVARQRGGWGGEVYEKGEMQRRVRELFWGLSMGDLIQQLWWNGTVEDEIAVEQLDFFHRLPSPYGLRRWCRSWWWALVARLQTVWVWSI